MHPLTKPYDALLQALLLDPAEAAAYLTAALEDGDPAILHAALHHCAQAWGEALPPERGGMPAVEQWLRRHGLHLVLRPAPKPMRAPLAKKELPMPSGQPQSPDTKVQITASPLVQTSSSASVGLPQTPGTVYVGFQPSLERVRIQASPLPVAER